MFPFIVWNSNIVEDGVSSCSYNSTENFVKLTKATPVFSNIHHGGKGTHKVPYPCGRFFGSWDAHCEAPPPVV